MNLSWPGQELKVLLENQTTDTGNAIKRNRNKSIRDVATELHRTIVTVHNIVYDQSTSFFSDLIPNLSEHWDACLKAMDDCFIQTFLFLT